MGGLKTRGVVAGLATAAVALMAAAHRGEAATPAQSTSSTPPASQPRPTASGAPTLSAKALVGAWAEPGLSCATPLRISLSGSRLSIAVAGGISNFTIPRTRSAPNVLEVSGDGVQTFRLQPGGVLTITAPGGSPAVLTRCAD